MTAWCLFPQCVLPRQRAALHMFHTNMETLTSSPTSTVKAACLGPRAWAPQNQDSCGRVPLTSLQNCGQCTLTWLFIPSEPRSPLGNCPYVVLEIRLLTVFHALALVCPMGPLWEVATPRPCLVAPQLLSASLTWAGKGT